MTIEASMHEIEGPGGRIRFHLFRPGGRRRLRTVIVYMDVFGPREELFAICRWFVEAGFAAVLPNLYSRLGNPVFPAVDEKHGTLPPDCIEANAATTMEMTLADSRAIIAEALTGRLGFMPEAFFAMGFCMGGRHALAAVVGAPEMLAGVSAHGGQLVNASPHSPHLLIEVLEKPFCFFHATDDETCPEEHQAIIAACARRARGSVSSVTLPAFHGWSFSRRWAFDAAASDHVFDQAFALFSGAGEGPRTSS